MTRDEFLERHRHELAGLVLDAAVGERRGADLAIFLRNAMKRTDALLGAVWADLDAERTRLSLTKENGSERRTVRGAG